jgi:hypothetical protein
MNGEMAYYIKRQGGIYYKGDMVLSNALNEFFKVDRILLMLGICGLFYVAIRKDVTLVLWVIPYLIFLYMIVWVTYFHLLIMLPAFCIAAAVLLGGVLVDFVPKDATGLI